MTSKGATKVIDPAKTFALAQGSLINREQTWQQYLPEANDWQHTLTLLTVPLIVVCGVLAYVLGLVFGGGMFGIRPTLLSTLGGMVFAVVAACIVAFIVAKLGGIFGGKSDFALSLAATTLAFVPGYLGQVANAIPWIGPLLGLALFIYALVLLWRILPMYLDIPADKRVVHYVGSLVASFIVLALLSMLLGGLFGTGERSVSMPSETSSESRGESGMFGGIMRQAEIMAAAEEDRYDPPSDGEVDKSQVQSLVKVAKRSKEILAEKAERMKELSERAERNEDISFNDLSTMMRGGTELMGMNTVEMELVKSAGGNWAEHQWVKQSLRTAWMQQEGSPAIEHNFRLYTKYEEELSDLIAR